ncbi:MAG: inorganic phosphate transporter, partial [Gammaproteobacteria bacterium]|nr:inorganic phosphate transporter [Gammaproteobacteria bacterium]
MNQSKRGNFTELSSIDKIDQATETGRRETARIGVALLFIVSIMLYTYMLSSGFEGHIMLVIAAMMGGYMALNIGANDVANNVGPAVGSQALTMVGAIVLAGIFEASGALVAGGDVVGTIKGGIISPDLIPAGDTFVWLMMGALLAGAIWLNVATALGAPVS